MDNKIFGYDFKDIQAMQQKTYKPRTIDTSKPLQYHGWPVSAWVIDDTGRIGQIEAPYTEEGHRAIRNGKVCVHWCFQDFHHPVDANQLKPATQEQLAQARKDGNK